MRTWVKATLGGVALLLLGLGVLAGTSAYFVMRHLDVRPAREADTAARFEAVKARFSGRAPLIEIVGPGPGDLRVQRPDRPDGRRVTTLHVLTWNAEDEELFQTEVPLWLMRFSTLNVLSKLGVAPERFRLTVNDIERYGPGLIADYHRPGQTRVMIWAD